AALIERLDECSDSWLWDSGLNPVEALIQEREPAVEPLLECLEKDERLTRAVCGRPRPFYRGLRIWSGPPPRFRVAPVHEAALGALGAILHVERPRAGGGSVSDRAVASGQLRAYWAANRALPFEDRWYRVLADDSASADDWQRAAANLLLREEGAGF